MLSQNPNTSVTPRNTMVKRPEQRRPGRKPCPMCGGAKQQTKRHDGMVCPTCGTDYSECATEESK